MPVVPTYAARGYMERLEGVIEFRLYKIVALRGWVEQGNFLEIPFQQCVMEQ